MTSLTVTMKGQMSLKRELLQHLGILNECVGLFVLNEVGLPTPR